jgi:hypothetical protein
LTIEEAFAALAAIPTLVSKVDALQREVAALRRSQPKAAEADGWLDAKRAAEYMSVSASTFEKYRYSTNPKLPGHNLDGKTLFKKSELDTFIRLYEARSSGIR